MENIILKTEKLTKLYKTQKANDAVTLEIKAGEIYGFIGVNGAGKTTFMRMICGLTNPTSGSYSLFGCSRRKDLENARKNMGALIEHPALIPYMTGLQNMIVQGRNKGIKKQDGMEEYLSLLELVGLNDAIKRKASEYSMGMKQRLGLAMALIGKPQFVILDEPYVGLDPIGVVELRNLLKKLNNEGLTILFSSHNLSEMSQIATKFIFINRGRIIRCADAETIMNESDGNNLESYFVNMVNAYGKE